jgi:predicted transcriptional regulator of viral defense system
MDDTAAGISPRKPSRACLFDIASGQAGYFTTAQAHSCGFSRALLSHHSKDGPFVRVRRGLYRLQEYPSSPREHLLAAWLATGKDTAVVSHESALDLLNLSDIVPDAVHLTVVRSRRNVPSVPGVRIHTTDRPIGPNERLVRDGVILTSAARSIVDSAEKGAAPEQIEMAVAQAVERGLATPVEIRQAVSNRSRRVRNLVAGALNRVAP